MLHAVLCPRYGLSKEQLADVEAQLAEVHSLARDTAAPGAALMTGIAALDIMGTLSGYAAHVQQ